jgi:hypothetical protein
MVALNAGPKGQTVNADPRREVLAAAVVAAALEWAAGHESTGLLEAHPRERPAGGRRAARSGFAGGEAALYAAVEALRQHDRDTHRAEWEGRHAMELAH